MMSNYNYNPPPPPPPPASSAHQGGYGQHQTTPYTSQHGHGRGGGGGSGGRGRGGHFPNNRPDYGAHQPAAHYAGYNGQPYPAHHSPPPYAGSHPPGGSYPPAQPQWPEHGHPPPHAHAPVPLSPSNYHPNYSQQQYSQYPPYPPPQHYAPSYAGPPPSNPPHWNGAGHSPSGGGGGKGRGGKSHYSGPPARHGYEHDPNAAPMNTGYGPPYGHDPRAGHYPPPQYQYAAPPAPPPQQDSFHPHSHSRGRGGHRGGGRGRGGHNNGDRSRHHNKHSNHDNHRHQNNNKTTDQTKQHDASASGKKKKRKTNTLGLTPGMESDTEDDEGEEKALAGLLGQDTYQVDDIAAFIAERQRNFPTKTRIEAKKAAQVARPSNKDKEALALEKEADKLRKQLRKVEVSIKRKREQGDEGDEMRDPSSAESSDDEKPEVMSSRSSAAPPPRPTQPAKKADVSKHCKYYSTGGTCGKKSKCRFVHDPEVREAAIKEREANHGRLTIQQRLILNDKEQEDLTILQSIQYLRQKGAMAENKDDVKEEDKEEPKEDNGDAPVALPINPSLPQPPKSLLPAAPASLPPPPIKRETSAPRRNPPPSIISSADSTGIQAKHYQTWLPQPYGSTDGKQSQGDDLP